MKGTRTCALVIDAGPRHTVDIVRSLGSHGFDVAILSSRPNAPASFSRFVACSRVQDLGRMPLDDGVDYVERYARQRRATLLLSSGLDGFRVLSHGRERLGRSFAVPAVAPEAFAIAEDKAEATRLAEKIGVGVPETIYPSSARDLHLRGKVSFPVVVKARRGQGHFGYARSQPELEETYARICTEVKDQVDTGIWPIVQEYVPGKGHGVYVLANHGEVRASFMHERIHEVPPTGGPSSLARTYYDADLLASGTAIVTALGWHGVAMVEFKKDARDGCYKLIEINPKFWGSLGLSIAAGVDFPYLLAKMALEGDVPLAEAPRLSLTYQWLSMDIAHSWAVRKPWLWLGPVVRRVPNDFRFSDPLPNLVLLAQGAVGVIRGQRRTRSIGGAAPVAAEAHAA